jgi:hypothetical protein
MAVQVTNHATVFRVVPERVSAAQAFGGTGTFVFTDRRDALEEWREGDPLVFGNDGSSDLYAAGTQLYVRDPSLFSGFGPLVRKPRK